MVYVWQLHVDAAQCGILGRFSVTLFVYDVNTKNILTEAACVRLRMTVTWNELEFSSEIQSTAPADLRTGLLSTRVDFSRRACLSVACGRQATDTLALDPRHCCMCATVYQ